MLLLLADPRVNLSSMENKSSMDRTNAVAESIGSLASALQLYAIAISPKPETKNSAWLGRVWKFVETVLPSITMFAVGFVFIQGVELDLKREQFNAATAEKIQEFVSTLADSDPSQTDQKTRATALALGGFGSVAVTPLITIMELEGESKISAARLGLIQAGRTSLDSTCAILEQVMTDNTGSYRWQTRKDIVNILGSLKCHSIKIRISEFKENIGSMMPRKGDTPPDKLQRVEMKEIAEQAILQIEGDSK
jgi:hypothetical protein